MSIRNPRTAAPPLIAIAVVGLLLLFFWRFGYDWAVSDQEEIIPYLLHRLDSTLLQNDWFVQTQVSAFSVRDYTVSLLAGFSYVLPVWLTTVGVYLASWLAIAYSSYQIAWDVLRNHLASALAVAAVLVFTPQWTLGGNDLVGRMLTPSMLGWALALPAVLLWLRGHWAFAGFALGIAAWFQPLVGLLTATALVLSLLGKKLRGVRWTHLRPAVLLGGTFSLAALPTIVPLVMQQFGNTVVPPNGMPPFFDVMAEFRNPHHYLPSAFPASSYLRFGFLVVTGSAALIYLRQKGGLKYVSAVSRLLIVIGGLLIAGFIGTELYPVLFVAKLQLFKLTVIAKLLLAILAVGAAVEWAVPRVAHTLLQAPKVRWSLSVILLAAWGATALGISINEPVRDRLIRPWAHHQSALGQMERWIRAHTPRDEVFAIPPSNSSFRSNARRAAVVTFKAFPFQDREIIRWWERLTTLAPIDSIRYGGAAAIPLLDKAYHQQTARDWAKIADRYDVDFILVNGEEQEPRLPFAVRQKHHPWKLYQLPDQ